MKNGFWDRVLIYLYILLSIALAALVALGAFGVDLIGDFYANLEAQAPGVLWKLIVLGIFLILALLAVYAVMAILPARAKKRDFIILTGDENGQVKIALPALREMARHAVRGTADVKDMAVDISESGDAITVDIALDIMSGTHVPTVTMNMQRAVKSYIQVNCGVAVKDVSVVINSVLPAPEGESEPEKAVEAPPAAVEAPRVVFEVAPIIAEVSVEPEVSAEPEIAIIPEHTDDSEFADVPEYDNFPTTEREPAAEWEPVEAAEVPVDEKTEA